MNKAPNALKSLILAAVYTQRGMTEQASAHLVRASADTEALKILAKSAMLPARVSASKTVRATASWPFASSTVTAKASSFAARVRALAEDEDLGTDAEEIEADFDDEMVEMGLDDDLDDDLDEAVLAEAQDDDDEEEDEDDEADEEDESEGEAKSEQARLKARLQRALVNARAAQVLAAKKKPAKKTMKKVRK